MKSVLMIDNFDSFTFNLVEDLRRCQAKVTVIRNDVCITQVKILIKEQNITHLVFSPGPGAPENSGNTQTLIRDYYGQLPMLGVCLGMQAMVVALEGRVTRHHSLMHGKSSKIYFQPSSLFAGLINPLTVGRYHSLVAVDVKLPLQICAVTEDAVMAIMDEQAAVYGLQFHPESILTPQGRMLLMNFLNTTLSKIE